MENKEKETILEQLNRVAENGYGKPSDIFLIAFAFFCVLAYFAICILTIIWFFVIIFKGTWIMMIPCLLLASFLLAIACCISET